MPSLATAVTDASAPQPARPARTDSIDLLRGIVMVLMVLDHARDFFWGFRFRATDLAVTTVPLFFTRWLTHFCAPTFVLLAGLGAYFYGRRHGPGAVTSYLLTRGLWLVLLEVTVIRLCWIPDPGYHITVLQVIWVLGWSMIALAALHRLPLPALIAVGTALVAGHNLLDGIDHQKLGAVLDPLWTILHRGGRLAPAPGRTVFVSYPLLPWIGVMSLGYALGAIFVRPLEQRRRLLLRLGLGACAAFVVLRALNAYGDPVPWTHQARGPVWTALSFLNCQKYPPSLLFLLMTLGPALCLLALLDRGPAAPARAPLLRPLLVFGRVPLLFYVGHLMLLRYTSLPMGLHRWGAAGLKPPPGHAGSPELPLAVTYLAWGLALLLLYPLCRWFAALKARRTDRWLSYL
jgi:uncharacterized membrane protein